MKSLNLSGQEEFKFITQQQNPSLNSPYAVIPITIQEHVKHLGAIIDNKLNFQ